MEKKDSDYFIMLQGVQCNGGQVTLLRGSNTPEIKEEGWSAEMCNDLVVAKLPV